MAEWPPETRYLVAVNSASGPGHLSVRKFETLAKARSEVDYWARWLPKDPPPVIVKAVTTYEPVDAAE